MGAIICANGTAVWEAEDFDASVPRSSHEWEIVTPGSGEVGSAVQSLPDNGTRIASNITTSSPELQYVVNFDQAGTYTIWFRALAVSDGNTVHAGLDDSVPAGGTNLDTPVTGLWEWLAGSLEVPSVGEHTVSLYMREDGMSVDRIVMTTDETFTPSGMGPAVTGREATTTTGLVQRITVVSETLTHVWVGPTPDNAERLLVASDGSDAEAAFAANLITTLSAAATNYRKVVAVHENGDSKITKLEINPI